MTQQKLELPKGWEKIRLGDYLNFQYGKGLTKKDRKKGNIPVYGSSGIDGYHNKSLVKTPSLVIGRKGSAGNVQLVEEPFWAIDTTYFVEETFLYDIKFLFHLLTHFSPKFIDSSTAVPSLRRDDAYAVNIPVVPLNEQKRIVSKIEELFSKIDFTKQSLEQTKLQLELYKQSLLKSVFSELSQDALSNISIINPKKPGKGETDDNLDVSFIPMKCVEEKSGKIDLSNIRKYGDVKKGFTYFQDKDLIFAKITPCMENGKIAMVDNLKNGMGFGSTEFHVIRFDDEYSPKFYFWYLIQDIFRGIAQQNMKGTAGQKRIQTNYLKDVLVPVATIEEKKQVIQTIEAKMPLIQNTTQIVNSTLQTLETMRMSVLKQAFQGKLVPQDPNDESAEILLERIKKQKS